MISKTIKFATIGTNFVVEWFLETAKKCDILEYKATYSRNIKKAEDFGNKYGSALFFDNLISLGKMSRNRRSIYCESEF